MAQPKRPVLNIILIVIATFWGSQVSSQNYIYKGTQQIPSTSTWNFTTSGGISGNISVTVAKSNTIGYLLLAIDVPMQEFSISGSVYLILQNGNMVTLNSRVAKDHVDDKSKVLFSISPANYALLRKNDIMQIRFSIANSMMKTKENYTAKNERTAASIYDSPKYETAIEIDALKD